MTNMEIKKCTIQTSHETIIVFVFSNGEIMITVNRQGFRTFSDREELRRAMQEYDYWSKRLYAAEEALKWQCYFKELR